MPWHSAKTDWSGASGPALLLRDRVTRINGAVPRPTTAVRRTDTKPALLHASLVKGEGPITGVLADLVASIAQLLLDHALHRRKMRLDDVPGEIECHAEIAVHSDVAKATDPLPRDLGVARAEVMRKLTGSIRKSIEAPKRGITLVDVAEYCVTPGPSAVLV